MSSEGGNTLGQTPLAAPSNSGDFSAIPLPANVAVDSEGRLAQPTRCMRCQYELKGLLVSDPCPECGTPISRSLVKDSLLFASPAYVHQLYRGLHLVYLTLLVAIGIAATGFLFQHFAGGSPPVLATIATTAIANGIVHSVGWWMASHPDASLHSKKTGRFQRSLIRIACIIHVFYLISLALFALFGWDVILATTPNGQGFARIFQVAAIMSLATFGCFAFLYISAVLYLRWIAVRLPDPDVGTHARALLWSGSIALLTCIFSIAGPLIAAGLYFALLRKIRADVRAVLARITANPSLTERKIT